MAKFVVDASQFREVDHEFRFDITAAAKALFGDTIVVSAELCIYKGWGPTPEADKVERILISDEEIATDDQQVRVTFTTGQTVTFSAAEAGLIRSEKTAP